MSSMVAVDVGGVVDGVMNGLDKLFTSDDERASARLQIQSELQKPHMMQAMITLAEAKHTNWFVAGWRPAIGWLCALCLGYHWLIKDFIMIMLVTTMEPEELATIVPMLPTIDSGEITGLVLALLGLGGMRSWERLNGKARG